MFLILTSDVIRTTLDLDSPVLEALKRRGKLEKKSLGQIASELLLVALKKPNDPPRKKRSLTWHTKSMKARIDLEDKDTLYRMLDQSK